jgi:hypothetical protein
VHKTIRSFTFFLHFICAFRTQLPTIIAECEVQSSRSAVLFCCVLCQFMVNSLFTFKISVWRFLLSNQ